MSSVLARIFGLIEIRKADAYSQHRWRLHRRILPHVNVDTILMGHHQRAGSDLVFLCDSGRLVKGRFGNGALRFEKQERPIVYNVAITSKHKSKYTYSGLNVSLQHPYQ